MGENNELKNRYMLVNPPEEWIDRTSTPQVQDKYGTSTGQVQDKYRTSTGQVEYGQSEHHSPYTSGWRARIVCKGNDEWCQP